MTRSGWWGRATVKRTSLIGLLSGIFLLIVPILAFSQTASRAIEYLSPQPGSALVSQQSNIIIRAKNALDPSVPVDASDVVVTGSQSGEHAGTLTLSDDGRTLVFKPSSVFAPNESVTVKLRPGLLKGNDVNALPLQFGFTTSPLSSLDQEMFLNHWASSESLHPSQTNGRPSGQLTPTVKSVADTNDSLPRDFPKRTIMTSGATAPGSLFLASFKISQAGDHYAFVSLVPCDEQYLMILDNSGTPGFYRAMGSISTDFKLQPNGRLTYNDGTVDIFYELDSNYVVIDAFQAGNGYRTNVHDLHVSPNGHALILADDPEIVRMDTIVPGGNPNATVIGAVIQELDQNKNVVFQWRSFDHFQITDATHEDLTADVIDAVHPNTIEIDTDGNLLLSSRHLDEITKINRATGDIIWRWGGKNNQFTFTNDTIRFSHQHTIRRTSTGTLILFDNGNDRDTPGSRAVEYSMDEQAKTVTLVWQFSHSPDVRTTAMGSVQRLPNGNTLIGWGSASPAATEVRPDKSVAFEIRLPDSVVSYRAFRFPWKQTTSVTAVQSVSTVPHAFLLAQNYPNPFNPTTKIQFSLPRQTTVNLAVFDMLGRLVATLASGSKPAGTYSVQFDASRLASGAYLYRLSTPEMSLSRIMAVVK